MKKILIAALGLFAAFSLFSPDISAQVDLRNLTAQLIAPDDCPSGVCTNTSFGGSLRQAIVTVINFALFFLGIIAVAMVIFAGYLYLTSRGDDGQVEKAKKTLLYAILGIVVVILSFAIVNTVIQVGQGQRPV